MNIVIPMAGAGSRFAAAGYAEPKPLIPVFGEPMYAWAVRSLPLDRANRVVFVCLQEHLDAFPFESEIRNRFPELTVVVLGLRQLTGGQAETVLAAQEWIDNDDPLLIFNADTFVPEPFQPPDHDAAVDGVIQTFRSSDPRYSFAKLGSDGLVEEVAEKVAISDNASTGLYYFSKGRDFVQFTREFLAKGKRANGESYVMLTYAEMLQAGKRIAHQPVSAYWVLGTPEELAVFLREYRN